MCALKTEQTLNNTSTLYRTVSGLIRTPHLRVLTCSHNLLTIDISPPSGFIQPQLNGLTIKQLHKSHTVALMVWSAQLGD